MRRGMGQVVGGEVVWTTLDLPGEAGRCTGIRTHLWIGSGLIRSTCPLSHVRGMAVASSEKRARSRGKQLFNSSFL